MSENRIRYLAPIFISFIVGLATYMIVYMTILVSGMLLSPTKPGSTPETGALGFFVVVATFFFPIFYLVEFTVIGIPVYIAIQRRLRPYSAWRWTLIGGGLFAVSMPVWTALLGVDFTPYLMGLAAIVGGAAFFTFTRILGRRRV